MNDCQTQYQAYLQAFQTLGQFQAALDQAIAEGAPQSTIDQLAQLVSAQQIVVLNLWNIYLACLGGSGQMVVESGFKPACEQMENLQKCFKELQSKD